MSEECNHIHLLGPEAGKSAVRNGKCSICGELSPTLQPFDHLDPPLIGLEKIQSGEVDKVFRATCPQCDGHVWVFVPAPHRRTNSGLCSDEKIIDPDARACSNCGYVHWLRGPNTSEVVPLPHHEPAYPSKKDRVRALVHSLLTGGYDIESRGFVETVDLAGRLDREIEGTK
jgi:hypothetical protein